MVNRKLREKDLDRALTRAVEQAGGLCCKTVWVSRTGAPDRTIILPGGVIWFVELKQPRGGLQPRQQYVGTILQKKGCNWAVIASQSDLNMWIEKNLTFTPDGANTLHP